MIKENFLKILKRIAIIFLIVVFSIAGIVACSDEDIMGNASAGLTDDTGIGTPNEPTFTFPRTHI